MTREDIIRMAREAGTVYATDTWTFALSTNQLERFADLVAAAELEACAMRAWSTVLALTDQDTADIVLRAIRARGQA